MSDAKEYRVDFRGVNLPDLIGEHDGREAQDNSDGKRLVIGDRINVGAYFGGGTWLIDKWLPAKKVKDIEAVQPSHNQDKTSISIAKS